MSNITAEIVNNIETKFNKSKDLKIKSNIIPRLKIKLLIKKLKNKLKIKVNKKNRGMKNNKN